MPNPKCCAVQGYRTNKSTAFSPNGAKFGQQSLLHNHMMNHYKLIEKAKSSIDNKPPKCMNNFIKAQDRKARTRKIVSTTNKEEVLHKRYNTQKVASYAESDALWTEGEFLSRLHKEMIDNEDDMPIQSFSVPRANSAPSYQRGGALPLTRSSTPRYKVEMYSPEIKPNLIKGSFYHREKISAHSLNQNKYRENLTQSFNKVDSNQNLSVWSSASISYKDPSLYTRSMRLNMSTLSLDEKLNYTQTLNRYSNKDLPMYEVNRLQKQEELIAEEQLYLQFIEEVTSDILVRGIFSDRVLNQVFDTHLEKRKGFLNEGRMRSMLEELKEDLGVKESPTMVTNTNKRMKEDKRTKNEDNNDFRTGFHVSNSLRVAEFEDVEENGDDFEDVEDLQQSMNDDMAANALEDLKDDVVNDADDEMTNYQSHAQNGYQEDFEDEEEDGYQDPAEEDFENDFIEGEGDSDHEY